MHAIDSQQFGIPNNHTYAIKVGDCFVNRVAYENLKLAYVGFLSPLLTGELELWSFNDPEAVGDHNSEFLQSQASF